VSVVAALTYLAAVARLEAVEHLVVFGSSGRDDADDVLDAGAFDVGDGGLT